MQTEKEGKPSRIQSCIGCWIHLCVLTHLSCVRLFETLQTVALQASLSMGFSRQEYWSGLPCSPPGDLPNLGIKPTSLRSPALADGLFTIGTIWGYTCTISFLLLLVREMM